jgi:hypothetical protein
MTISTTWINNYLFKKVGYGVADTSLAKSPASESTPSPFLNTASTLWQLSGNIASASAPSLLGNSSVVTVYNGAGTIQCVNDITSNVAYQTWTTGLTNWIPTQFGAGYQVQVYAGPPGTANPQTLKLLLPDGSGNNDGWYFDYQAGVLIFADTNVPTAVAGNVVYVSGARYTGPIGVSNFSNGLTIGNISITGNTITGNADVTFGGNITAANSTFTAVTTTLLSATNGNIGNLVVANLSTANAQITGGNVTNINNLTAANSALTTLVTTNFSTSNAQIAGGNITASFANFTTTRTTNFSSGNAVITGGNIDATPIGFTTANTGRFTQLTSANLSVTDATQSDSTTTGAVTVAGGIGIGKNLTVGGNAVIAGSLTVNGIVEYVNTVNSSYVDTILDLNTGANGAPLTGPNGYDVGINSHYYASGADQTAFFGYQNSSGYFVYFNRVTSEAGNVVTGTLGTIKSGQLIVANTTPSLDYTTGAITVAGGVGIAGNLNVNSDISANNISAPTGTISANIGNFVNINSIIADIQANLGAFETYANSTNSNSGSYQTWANANMANLAANIGNLQSDTGAYYAWANANLAYTTTVITTLDANVGSYETYANANIGAYQTWANDSLAGISTTISSIQANVGAYETWANANLAYTTDTINSINANLGAYETWANANLAELSTEISTLQANVGAYETWANANLAELSTEISTLQANVGAYEIWANANLAYTTETINSINANLGAYETWANANLAYITTTIATLDANVGAYEIWANANLAYTTTTIATLDANVGAYETWANANLATQSIAINSLATGANANTAAYLATYTGNISAGNVTNVIGVYSSNYYYANGVPFLSTTIANTADITANVSGGNNVGLSLTPTGVIAGGYGNSITIPTVVVDTYGRVTSLTSNAISVAALTINLSGTTGIGAVSGGGTLTFAGDYGVTTRVTDSTVTVGTPQDLQTTAAPQFASANITTINAGTVNALTVGNANTVLNGSTITLSNDGFITGNLTIVGNLSLLGNTLITESNNLSVSDAVINLHTPTGLGPLTVDDGLNVGIAFHYYDGGDQQAFLARADYGPYRGNLVYYSQSTDSIDGNVTGTTLGSFVTGNISATDTISTQGNLNVGGNLTVVKNLTVGGNVGNLVLAPGSGISTNGSFGSNNQVLMSRGAGVVPTWATTYYYPTDMYDFTAQGLGWATVAPNQDPATLGFLPDVAIPYGAVWVYTTNPGTVDTPPITIYSPNSTSTIMMWVTVDGKGPAPAGSDYWFNITPPPNNPV